MKKTIGLMALLCVAAGCGVEADTAQSPDSEAGVKSLWIPPAGTYEIRRTYYSDSSKTTVIGSWRYDCYGDISTSGSSSGYITESKLSCPSGLAEPTGSLDQGLVPDCGGGPTCSDPIKGPNVYCC